MIKFYSFNLIIFLTISFLFTIFCQSTFKSKPHVSSEESERLNSIEGIARFKNKEYIKYSITNGINLKKLKEALKILERNTCLRFKFSSRLRPWNFGLHFLGYMAIRYPNNVPGENELQNVFISNRTSNNIGYLLQQTLLSMGFIPQHQRPDRDSYIKFVEMDAEYRILLEDKYLDKYDANDVNIYDTSYDYGSITEFATNYFSEITSSVMEARKNPIYNRMMGQQYGLSFNDVKLINLAICSDKCPGKKLNCKNNGYLDPLSCEKCRCPNGFDGVTCERVAVTKTHCGETNLLATKDPAELKRKGPGVCNYLITSKKGYKIIIQIVKVEIKRLPRCFEKKGLEIKYRTDFGATGLCICDKYTNFNLTSETNQVLIQYNGDKKDYFKILYSAI
uniref:ZnMc domain-containing protein n=1 Tax=Strongyloides papillosus TaxID=174720 RepID=A0A0N5C0Q6_STREA